MNWLLHASAEPLSPESLRFSIWITSKSQQGPLSLLAHQARQVLQAYLLYLLVFHPPVHHLPVSTHTNNPSDNGAGKCSKSSGSTTSETAVASSSSQAGSPVGAILNGVIMLALLFLLLFIRGKDEQGLPLTRRNVLLQVFGPSLADSQSRKQCLSSLVDRGLRRLRRRRRRECYGLPITERGPIVPQKYLPHFF
ncbi:hypothetical protein BDZ97DRAFT_999093 [Flammula alnicola]|nr:hypothetical protein BDZ97DRAFT_999093 [Flammula alnicola]